MKVDTKVILLFCIGLTLLFPIVQIKVSSNNTWPLWLIGEAETPNKWTYDSKFNDDDKYISFFKAPSSATISITTVKHNTTDYAQDHVNNDIDVWTSDNLTLEYRFPQHEVQLSAIDTGYVWEVNSPCCISRGVIYSFNDIYIYIFGSEKSEWDEIRLTYSLQTVKLYEYFELDIPEYLQEDIKKYTPKEAIGFEFSVLVLAIAIYGITRKKKITKRD